MIATEHDFADRQALATALAGDVAAALTRAITATGSAVLAVSGGTTPKLFFDALSGEKLAWDHVTITLVDERQVPDTSDRSNAKLVKEHLLKNEAAAARFVPMFGTPADQMPARLDVVTLGMGNDGHTASFFPGGDTLAEAIDPSTPQKIIAISAPGSGEARLTYTLPVLLAAGFRALHLEGDEKRDTLKRALADGPVPDMPVRAVLRSPSPVSIYWCP
ncbi:6-phosphogluconolactonase [Aestuariivirga sp.]|uniref:6-phosphogluconolactonase n=1 Tax=Aestuariivirga sp. TaxID=2650926 RepID=UPI0039E25018